MVGVKCKERPMNCLPLEHSFLTIFWVICLNITGTIETKGDGWLLQGSPQPHWFSYQHQTDVLRGGVRSPVKWVHTFTPLTFLVLIEIGWFQLFWESSHYKWGEIFHWEVHSPRSPACGQLGFTIFPSWILSCSSLHKHLWQGSRDL